MRDIRSGARIGLSMNARAMWSQLRFKVCVEKRDYNDDKQKNVDRKIEADVTPPH